MRVVRVRPTDDKSGREYYRYWGLGFEFTVVVGVFFYLGHLADRHWHWDPWGLLLGGGFGLSVGLYHLAKEGNKMMRTLDKDASSDSSKTDESGHRD